MGEQLNVVASAFPSPLQTNLILRYGRPGEGRKQTFESSQTRTRLLFQSFRLLSF